MQNELVFSQMFHEWRCELSWPECTSIDVEGWMVISAWADLCMGYMVVSQLVKRIHAGASMNMKLTFQSKFTSTVVADGYSFTNLCVLMKQISDNVKFEYMV